MSTTYDPTAAVRWKGTPSTRSNPPECIAISIVSNSRLLCEGLIGLLHTQLNMMLIAIYEGGDIAQAAAAMPVYDHVVLIDCGLGKESAVAWTRFWREQHPTAQVVVFELVDDHDAVMACIEAGAGGYTVRGASVTELAETITRVRHDAAHSSPTITGHLFAWINSQQTNTTPFGSAVVPITPRELEVLACAADGLSNQEIAARLVIEVRTVKHHMHNIIDKLQVRSRWQAVRVARERNWLPSRIAVRA